MENLHMAKKKHANTNDLPTNPELSSAVEVANLADAPLAPESNLDAPADTTTNPVEPAPADAPESSAAPASKKKGGKRKAATTETTLAEMAEGYLAHLEASGKSNGTIFSYRLELAVALDELGAETKLAELTSERVLAFFASDRVNKTRTGVLKARVSVLKTQRVLRQALVWAAERRLVEKAPLPEDAATF
ncbi:MAG: hypothetical protein IPJ77_19130 [Planctomycetes bacterium]|nr:hypothetical protein [Planctomycetota bacterium]